MQQTEGEYIAPTAFYELKADLRALEMKLRVHENYMKEVLEDLDLKGRSLETVIKERNDERDKNTDLRLINFNLTTDLNITVKKFEETGARLNEVQNNCLVLETEKARLVEACRGNDVKIERLTKGIKDLRQKMIEMQNEKVVLEQQLVKVFKKFGMANKKMKPTDVVNKNRPNSSSRSKAAEANIKRNRSREEIPEYEEIEGFLDFGRRAKKKPGKDDKGKRKQRHQGKGHESVSEDELERSDSYGERGDDRDSSPQSMYDRSNTSSPDRSSRHLKVPGNPKGSRRAGNHTPQSSDSNSSREAKRKSPYRGTSSLIKKSSSQSSVSKVEAKSLNQSFLDENPWVPSIGAVQENVYEENKGHAESYTTRSLLSITTTSSEEGLNERTIINEQGEVITVIDKKVDTRQLKVINVRTCTKSVQFDSDEPEMDYAKDGTAVTKDGQARFYLPFNPNVVFGLKGDAFYHTLFKVFQATSKVQDGSAIYVPPYKLEEEKEVPVPRMPPPRKRSPKKTPHSNLCGVNCKHLTKNVKPKVRDDMVLVLKKQELVI